MSDSMDAAWAEAEAALRAGNPDLYELRIGRWVPQDVTWSGAYWADGWHGSMEDPDNPYNMRGVTTYGPSPAAALRALAAALLEDSGLSERAVTEPPKP